MADQSIQTLMRTYTRSAQFVADARERLRPAVSAVTYGGASDYSVTATTFTVIDDLRLAGTISTTGGPVELSFVCQGTKGTTNLRVSVLWDGLEVTGRDGGMARSLGSDLNLCGLYVIGAGNGPVSSVSRGMHRFSLAACVDGGTGTVLAGAVQTITLLAKELT